MFRVLKKVKISRSSLSTVLLPFSLGRDFLYNLSEYINKISSSTTYVRDSLNSLQITFCGVMSEEEKNKLLKYAPECTEYKRAIEALFSESQLRNQEIELEIAFDPTLKRGIVLPINIVEKLGLEKIYSREPVSLYVHNVHNYSGWYSDKFFVEIGDESSQPVIGRKAIECIIEVPSKSTITGWLILSLFKMLLGIGLIWLVITAWRGEFLPSFLEALPWLFKKSYYVRPPGGAVMMAFFVCLFILGGIVYLVVSGVMGVKHNIDNYACRGEMLDDFMKRLEEEKGMIYLRCKKR